MGQSLRGKMWLEIFGKIGVIDCKFIINYNRDILSTLVQLTVFFILVQNIDLKYRFLSVNSRRGHCAQFIKESVLVKLF